MFYSEQLLAKTGPLARVWLASNVERKLTKSQILQSDISSSVNVIVDQTAAPLALRLSGQLMLGVVRIYNRKSKYLLDDANEALLKIRMTFKRADTHDMPAQPHVITTIEVQDDLTMEDLFPALDYGFPMLTQPIPRLSQGRTLEDEDWLSSLEPHTQSEARIEEGLHYDDLGIDIGADVGMEDTTISIQLGRGEAPPRPDDAFAAPAIEEGEGLEIDIGEDVPMPDLTRIEVAPAPVIEEEARLPMAEDETAQLREASVEESESPLSEPDLEMMQELARPFAPEEEVEEARAAQRQALRRRKPLIADVETVLHNREIKGWSDDRSKITKPLSLLPQDSELLALLEMQRTGAFVTNAMSDGFSRGLAPELQGLLTFEIAYRSGQKRKRDSGVADVASEDERGDKSPRLERPSAQVEEEVIIEDEGIDVRESPFAPISAEIAPGEEVEGIFEVGGEFDETTVPLVHPADSGPISVGTQQVVNLLRETFGGTPESGSPQPQTTRSIILQDLIPERRTSKDDATKMFFEILVLATKDAIKVEQDDREIGLPIRVRAKRGLWGDWAEPSTQIPEGVQEVSVGA